jgi:hypothetical protein
MPQPEGAQLNPSGYSPLLTGIAGGLMLSMDKYIAEQIAPTIPVAAPSGTYPVWLRGDFMRRGGKRLANYEAPPIEGFASSSANYAVDNWGVATIWTARDLASARAGGTNDADFIQAKLDFVVGKGALEKEIQTAALCQTPGNWAITKAGVAGAPGAGQFRRWDDASSDPVQDVIGWLEALRLSTGINANTIVLPRRVVNALKINSNLIDRIKYGGTMDRPTQVTEDQMKMLFGIERMFVPESVYNAAAEGQPDNFQYIWGDSIWIGYVAPRPSRDTPSAIYNFAWTGDTTQGLPVGVAAGAGPQPWDAQSDRRTAGLFIRRFRENRPSAEFCESELWISPNVSARDAGFTLTTPITP